MAIPIRLGFVFLNTGRCEAFRIFCFCAFCKTLTKNLHVLHKKYARICTGYHKLYLSLPRQNSVRTE